MAESAFMRRVEQGSEAAVSVAAVEPRLAHAEPLEPVGPFRCLRHTPTPLKLQKGIALQRRVRRVAVEPQDVFMGADGNETILVERFTPNICAADLDVRRADPEPYIALTIDVEQDVWVFGSKLRHARRKPQLCPVRVSDDVNFGNTLKVEFLCHPIERCKSGLQIGQGAFQFRSGPQAGAAPHQEVDAEVGLEAANTLPNRGRGDSKRVGSIFEGAGPERHVERLQGPEMGRGLHLIKFIFSRQKFQPDGESSALVSERKSGFGFQSVARKVDPSHNDRRKKR